MLNVNENFNYPWHVGASRQVLQPHFARDLAWSREIRTAAARSVGESVARRKGSVRSGNVPGAIRA